MSRNKNWPSTRQSLLVGIQGPGEQDAWRELVGIYAPLIYRYSLRKGLPVEDAEDVAQEVLLKITRFDYSAEKGRFRSWLATVTARQIRDRWKKIATADQVGAAAGTGIESIADPKSGAEGWDGMYIHRIFEVAVQRIRPEFNDDQWRVFEMLHGTDVSCNAASVAAELKRTIGWVYKVNHNITKRMSQVVGEMTDDFPLV